MCATNLWAVNAAAYTPEFRRFTADRLGTEPMETILRIASSRVRSSSVVFTLTLNMCDCGTFIGSRNHAQGKGEINADSWLGWLRDLPDHIPHLSRIAVLRAWSPEDESVVPARAHGISIDELSEEALRELRDDNLLTIDYPGMGSNDSETN